jgi:hypothetical protein
MDGGSAVSRWGAVLFATGERGRPTGAGRLNIPLAKCPAVKLALLADLLRAVGFAGRIERFPPGLLPGGTPVTKVDSRLAQYRVEAGPVRVGNSCRCQRAAAATDAFGVGASILCRNASLGERSDNSAGSYSRGRANCGRGQPTSWPAPFPAPSARSSTPLRSRSTFLSVLNQLSALLAT